MVSDCQGDLLLEELKQQVILEVEKIRDKLVELSDQIHENPELSMEEVTAASLLAKELEAHDFRIERELAKVRTAFRATPRMVKKPIICFLSEYDALPGLGHACGHHMSGVSSLGAVIAASKVVESNNVQGSVILVGTPAEEEHSGKVLLAEAGAFENVDAVMMVHAYDKNCVGATFLALDALQFDFQGRTAHAAGAPHEGINALNAVLITFRNVDALRQHIRSDVRIHGVITNGGAAPNIVPEKATARFYVRSTERSYLNEVVEKVENCARGAALATGSQVTITHYEPNLSDMLNNNVIATLYRENLEHFTSDIIGDLPPLGSSDIGNISYLVPTIHPMIAMAPKGVGLHTREFEEVGVSERAHSALLIGAKCLAMTAIDLLMNPQTLSEAKAELVERKRRTAQ